MTSQRRLSPRGGMTLVELLVVMFILGVLFAMGVFFYPDFSSKQKMTTATDRISGALLMAKQRAKRDGLATGVRFANNEMVFIQQPDTPSIGRVIGLSANTITINANLIVGGVEPLIQPLDYIEINGGGRLHQITSAVPSGANTIITVDYTWSTPENFPNVPQSRSLSNYRIFARPRVLAGEESIKLPNQVTLTVPVGSPDVVFSPAGSVILQTNTQGQAFLVVEDSNPVNAGSPKFIVAVRLRTGAIGTYPYSNSGDPYGFAKDGRSSGL